MKVLIGCLLSMSLFAQDKVVKQDFAFGKNIQLNGEQRSVYSLDLDEEVLNTLKSENLFDMRVFNSQGEVVPHRVYVGQDKATTMINLAPAEIAFFPLYSEKTEEELKRRIKIQDNGTLIEINQENRSSQKRVQAYLIDFSHMVEKPEAIEILVEQKEKGSFSKRLRLNWSDDLISFPSYGSFLGTLTRLEHQGNIILKNKIKLDAGMRFKKNYLKIYWGEDNLSIVAIKGIMPKKWKTDYVQQSQIKVATYLPSPARGTKFTYDLGTRYSIREFRFKAKQLNQFGEFSLETSQDNQRWESQGHTKIYALKTDAGGYLNQDPFELSFPITARYVRLSLKSSVEGFGQQAPEVTALIEKLKLKFLARGSAPFVLGYGSNKVKSEVGHFKFNTPPYDKDIGTASWGTGLTLGGEAMLSFQAPDHSTQKRMILWAVLILGVVLLSYMSFRLVGEMRSDK